MALTKEEKKMLQEVHDNQIKLSTVLLGADGNPGLVTNFINLAASHGKLRRNFWLLVGTLAGSGVIGGGISYLT